MADVLEAINYALSWEDATLSGIITVDGGGRTRFGIAEKYHPELTNCLFYTSMGQVAALEIARGIYDIRYAEPLCIAEIQSQDVANKLLSLGVNIGAVPAAKMLQDVLRVDGDGRIGPITLQALDQQDPAIVLQDFRNEADDYYRKIVAKDPSKRVFLEGWLRRANA